MTLRYLGLMLCVLLSGPAVFGQSQGGAADPITGTWIGELAPADDDRRIAVTLNLTFDGKGAVTGTLSGLPNPGDVKNGTFDLKTGALLLRLGRADGPAVLLVLDGTVAKGTATGKISGDAGSGTFRISRTT